MNRTPESGVSSNMNAETIVESAPGAGAVVAAEVALMDLARLTRDGDRDAREELARRVRQPAYVLALQLLGNPDDALDVAQDSMLRLFQSFSRFDPERPLKPWLARIVRNRARDVQRRRRARPAVSLDALVEGGFPESPAREAGPEERVARRQLQRRIWQALHCVSEAHREILVLRDYQDLSYAEIAAVLEIPLGTVMSRLHAARRSLRRVLENEGGAP